jgi:cytochrome b-561
MVPNESHLFKIIGPPAPVAITYIARAFQVIIFISVLVWISLLGGGLRFSPKVTDPTTGANDTSGVFNWHPLFMTFSFVICMGEAVLAYKRPVLPLPDTKPARKAWHVALHTLALVSGTFGLTAAIKSHTLKRPDAIPNFYSIHSWVGLLLCCLVLMQFSLGLLAYIAPTWSQPNREAFGAVHAYLGLSTFLGGLATMIVGIQEKTTFVQLLAKPDVTAGVMRLPAFIGLCIVLYAAAVAFHHAPSAQTRNQELCLSGDGVHALHIEEEPLHAQ